MPLRPRGDRKKRNETPEQRAARIARLKPIQPGEVRNPKGNNGRDWLKAAREFWEAKEPSLIGSDGGKKVPRAANLFASAHKQALLGSFQHLDFAAKILGINAPTKVEMTGADGAPLGPAQVLFQLGNAETLEDAEPVPSTTPPAEDDKPAPSAPSEPVGDES